MKAAPIALTQEEVEAMSGTSRLAAAVRRRLPTRKPRSLTDQASVPKKMAPVPVGKQDLAALRTGRPSAALLKKLFGRESSAVTSTTASTAPSKEAPTQAPPRSRTKR